MTYAGTRLCAAVNSLLYALDSDQDTPLPQSVHDRAEDLRHSHNFTLFHEAQSRELPDSRHEPAGVTGVERIARERERQVTIGYSSNHDDAHDAGELAMAAACYAAPQNIYIREDHVNAVGFVNPWPFGDGDDKRPRIDFGYAVDAEAAADADRIDLLVKAGALIAAEIDRIQRAIALREAVTSS